MRPSAFVVILAVRPSRVNAITASWIMCCATPPCTTRVVPSGANSRSGPSKASISALSRRSGPSCAGIAGSSPLRPDTRTSSRHSGLLRCRHWQRPSLRRCDTGHRTGRSDGAASADSRPQLAVEPSEVPSPAPVAHCPTHRPAKRPAPRDGNRGAREGQPRRDDRLDERKSDLGTHAQTTVSTPHPICPEEQTLCQKKPVRSFQEIVRKSMRDGL